MQWPQWNLDRAGIMGVASLTVAIVIVFALVMIYLPNQQQRANAGFGPDWDCVVQAKGDPICIKKPGR